jgi:hypothetical protein
VTFLLTPGAEPVPGFRLTRYIYRGGCGEVWQADGPGGSQVALKFVALNTVAADVEQRALDFFTTLRHPNLIALFGSWRIPGYLMIAMELADETLFDRHRDGGPASFRFTELVEYMGQAARGLDYLNAPRHRPPFSGGRPVAFQHRDIKPQNLLLVGGEVKVGDWGLIRMLEDIIASHTGYMTPPYAAPEFFQGKTSSTSDQYSLAVTYYFLRTGRLPFQGDQCDGHLNRPPELDGLPTLRERLVVERALAKNPQERWANCSEFATALRESGRTATTVLPAEPAAGGAPNPAGGLNAPPFYLGSVVQPEHFIDRDQELTRARGWVQDGQSFLLVGKRRVGKTSFCNMLRHQIMGSPRNQVLVVLSNLQAYGNLTADTFLGHTLLALVGEIARYVFRCRYSDLLQPDPAAGNVLLRDDPVFRQFIRTTGMIHERTQTRAGVAPAPLQFAEFEQLTRDLLHLVRLRGWARVAVIYDEANRLPRDLSVDLLVSNQEALHESGVVTVYVASPEMVAAFGPLYETFGRELRLGPFPSIRDLQRLLACYCLNDPRRVDDIPVTVAALELLWNATSGQPYVIQLLAGRSFDLACEEQADAVGAEHVTRAQAALRREKPQLFIDDTATG